MTNLEKVRAKVIEAVPEILELKFGCRVSFQRYPGKIVYGTIANKTRQFNVLIDGRLTPETHPKEIFTIIGRPITLADVLRAMKKKQSFWLEKSVCGFPEFKKSIGAFVEGEEKDTWNLAEDLDHQSEETIKSLVDILVI